MGHSLAVSPAGGGVGTQRGRSKGVPVVVNPRLLKTHVTRCEPHAGTGRVRGGSQPSRSVKALTGRDVPSVGARS